MATKVRKAHKSKTFKVDFYAVTVDGNRVNAIMEDLLKTAPSKDYTEALSLDNGAEEKFQIRSIVSTRNGRVYKGVFGRCRYGEKPVQGTEDGKEADVDLKPGHGLVEKNHFLFYAGRNMIVYQRNSSGSHISRFQRYINQATSRNVLFEPILTRDSYARLMHGPEVREIDVSFQQPKDSSLYQDMFTQDAVKLVKKVGGVNARIRISVGRTNRRLVGKIKDAAVVLAKSGLAKVARVKLEAESEPIDLIADRIVSSISVQLLDNGRPDPEAIYAGLAQAESDRSADLKTFFGR